MQFRNRASLWLRAWETRLKKKWWLWLLLPFISLAEDRYESRINQWIDQQKADSLVRDIASLLVSNFAALMVGALLLAIIVLMVHAYLKTSPSALQADRREFGFRGGLTIDRAKWYCTVFPDAFEDITERLQSQVSGKDRATIRAHQDAGWGDVCARHGGQGHHKSLDVDFSYRGSVSIPYDHEQVIPPQLSEPQIAPAFKLPLLIIRFNDAPLGKNWKIAEGGAAMSSSHLSDGPGDGYFQMESRGRFAMDRVINEPEAKLTNKLEFKVRLPHKAAIYAGILLRDAQGNSVLSPKDEGIFWITYQIGDPNLTPVVDERYANEKVVWISGPVIANGWILCSPDLKKDASAAYPGLFFSSLERIRFRVNQNTLSVSPIICYGD